LKEEEEEDGEKEEEAAEEVYHTCVFQYAYAPLTFDLDLAL